MFKFDNTHIFTGYLKQMLSSFNLPTCRVYTREFARYLKQTGKEDPRVIESFDNVVHHTESTADRKHTDRKRTAFRANYLKGDELYNYFWPFDQSKPLSNHNSCYWKQISNISYHKDENVPGLTRHLNSAGNTYDSATHEYLGDYLRFLRDYYNVNLMSLYNCFNNKICNNLYYQHTRKMTSVEDKASNVQTYSLFDSRDSRYRIYAIPVKLFSDYTIAIDCNQEIEMFCGFYNTTLDNSDKNSDFHNKTYYKTRRTFFKRPFLYDKLNVKYWPFEQTLEASTRKACPQLVDNETITRWDIANKEQDLKLFIKIPASCKSSIVVLEGDFRRFNDFKYATDIENSLIMDNCCAGEKVTISGSTISAALRGHAASITKGKCTEHITNCYSIANLANIDTVSYCGLIGPTGTSNSTITCCYNATGPIAMTNSSTDPNSDPSPGASYNVMNCYEYEAVGESVAGSPDKLENKKPNPQYTSTNGVTSLDSKSYFTGYNVLSATGALRNLNSLSSYIATERFPILKKFALLAVLSEKPYSDCEIEIWDGNLLNTSQPSLSTDGWYEITNGAELAYVVLNGGKIPSNDGAVKYKLTKDIFLNDPAEIDWTNGELTGKTDDYKIRYWYQQANNTNYKIKPFKGTIDGNGHIIYGLYFKQPTDPADKSGSSTGLFPIIEPNSNTTIINLGIDYAYFAGATYCAAFVGSILDPSNTTNNLAQAAWEYKQNSTIINFDNSQNYNLNDSSFLPISRLQLLAFNTGESYPFADRLIEYLSGSTITPMDEIPDNIMRAQKVMSQNGHYFSIEGLWEDKMQKIVYDYLLNSGPISVENGKLIDNHSGANPKNTGYHRLLGHSSKSTLFDTLGYIDKDAEKWYASWIRDGSTKDTIQNVDIYNGLYDI
jgi:hypothetical protein